MRFESLLDEKVSQELNTVDPQNRKSDSQKKTPAASGSWPVGNNNALHKMGDIQ
jgi:hypothetical protein